MKATVQVGRQRREVWCVSPAEGQVGAAASIRLSGPAEDKRATLWVGDEHQELSVATDGGLPAGIVEVDPHSFRQLAFAVARTRGRLPPAGQDEWAVEVSEMHYLALTDALRGAGLASRPLTAVRLDQLLAYKVRPRGQRDVDGNELAAAVEMARPTFIAGLPVVEVEADAAGEKLTLAGSTPADPGRFTAQLRHGRWLSGGSRDVVLPLETARLAFPGLPPADCLGRSLEVRHVRDRGVCRDDATLPLTFRVVGLVEGRADMPRWKCCAAWPCGGRARCSFTKDGACSRRRLRSSAAAAICAATWTWPIWSRPRPWCAGLKGRATAWNTAWGTRRGWTCWRGCWCVW